MGNKRDILSLRGAQQKKPIQILPSFVTYNKTLQLNSERKKKILLYEDQGGPETWAIILQCDKEGNSNAHKRDSRAVKTHKAMKLHDAMSLPAILCGWNTIRGWLRSNRKPLKETK